MGKVKLTPSIDEQLIITAKRVAHEKKLSVSEMVASYLATFKTSSEKSYEADKLYGIARSSLSELSDKEIRAMRNKDKYGI